MMPSTTPVEWIMTTDVVTVGADESVEEATARLTERGVTGAPVVDGEGRCVGLLDDTDLLMNEARVHAPSAIEILGAYVPLPGSLARFEQDVRRALATTVRDRMHADLRLLRPDDTAEDVATLLVEQDVSRLPVVDDEQRVVGLVSRHDLVVSLGRSEMGRSEATPPPADPQA